MAEDTLFSGESKNVEYKVTVPEKSEKYMKTVVAFANGRGGRIVFGIDDKTLDIVGMDVENIYKTMDAITNAISDACEPAIRPDVALQTVKDKTCSGDSSGCTASILYQITWNGGWNLCAGVRYNQTCGRIYVEGTDFRGTESLF